MIYFEWNQVLVGYAILGTKPEESTDSQSIAWDWKNISGLLYSGFVSRSCALILSTPLREYISHAMTR